MMESSLDHHHQEQQLGGGGASSFAAPLPHLDPAGRRFEWNPRGVVALDETSHNQSKLLLSSDLREKQCNNDGSILGAPPAATSMVRDLGLHWPYGATESNSNASNHFGDVIMMSTKEEDANSANPPNYLEERHHHLLLPTSSQLRDMSEKLLLKTLSPGFPLCAAGEMMMSPAAFLGGGAVFGRGNYSLVLPTANISPAGPPFSDPLPRPGLRVSDFLSSRFSALQREEDGALTLTQQPAGEYNNLQHDHRAEELSNSTSRNKTPAVVSGVREAKRGCDIPDGNRSASQPPAQKKPRVEPRSSVPPLKVRKEKLGDRIAALQQLVAPFGKTDTASVLMEAIGYIKFLQDQVQTLSVPYLRSSTYSNNNHNSNVSVQGGSNGGREEPKPDLRSRGLCLVPLSCTSYVTNENVGIWPPPDFRGGGT